MNEVKEKLMSLVLSEIGRRGGKMRAKRLTAEQRRESARRAANARCTAVRKGTK